MRVLAILLAMLATTGPIAAQAQTEHSVTLYGAYRFGGELTDIATGRNWELTDGGAYALAVDFGLNAQSQWGLFISHRGSALKASGFSTVVDNFGLDVTYYHLSGTYFPVRIGQGFYLVGGVGATQFDPKESGLNSETRLSLNLGVGYLIPLGRSLGIRLEARGYATIVESSGSMFCSAGCVVQIKGDTLTQGEVLAGISARF
jgi:hypothetical protein